MVLLQFWLLVVTQLSGLRSYEMDYFSNILFLRIPAMPVSRAVQFLELMQNQKQYICKVLSVPDKYCEWHMLYTTVPFRVSDGGHGSGASHQPTPSERGPGKHSAWYILFPCLVLTG
jgi:hypothetical protein